jgi:hypothetical protein
LHDAGTHQRVVALAMGLELVFGLSRPFTKISTAEPKACATSW